jgi:hypothetical protein
MSDIIDFYKSNNNCGAKRIKQNIYCREAQVNFPLVFESKIFNLSGILGAMKHMLHE